MPQTYSLYKISQQGQFGFSPTDYSRFKFGDDAVAKTFGIQLADGFIKTHLSGKLSCPQMVVISSPYSFIPTATFAMKNHFVFRLNRWLAANHFPVVQEAKVHRTITYKEDYGELSAEQRINLISNDSFHIDAPFLAGKTLLFLDDIKITGSHEKMIKRMIADYQLPNEIFMLYFAELVNHTIHPSIENYLNYFHVKSVFDLTPLIQSKSFFINTRLVKYILHYEHTGFKIFIDTQTEDFITLLYDMAIGNGYHTIDAYATNLNYLKNQLTANAHKHLQHGN